VDHQLLISSVCHSVKRVCIATNGGLGGKSVTVAMGMAVLT
jgi:hypothetical protein